MHKHKFNIKRNLVCKNFSIRLYYQNEVGCEHVEDSRQRSPDVVEGHSDVLQAQVVERDHGDENKRKRQNLSQKKHCKKFRTSKKHVFATSIKERNN